MLLSIRISLLILLLLLLVARWCGCITSEGWFCLVNGSISSGRHFLKLTIFIRIKFEIIIMNFKIKLTLFDQARKLTINTKAINTVNNKGSK